VANNDFYPSAAGQNTIAVAVPGVLTNDGGSGITAELIDPPANHSGTFTLNADGSFTYVLRSTSTATTDSFTYRARSGATSSNVATVIVNITPPAAVADTFGVSAPSSSASGNVLSNDTGSGLTAVLVGAPAHATGFTLNSNGSFSYTHNGDAAASDSFSYRAMAGLIASNTVTVTLNINQPPVAGNACASIIDGQTSVTGNLTATDPNGTTPTFEIVTQPGNGTVSTTPAGVFTYIPTANPSLRGMDKFTFRAKDTTNPSLYSQPATVSILNNGKVRIMPLGDSITQGVSGSLGCTPDTDGNCPLRTQRVSYRKKLFCALEDMQPSWSVDFVGSVNDGGGTGNCASGAAFDTNHEGHPGWCDDNNPFCTLTDGQTIKDNVISFLNSNPADIILLHIGTNHFDTNNAGVNDILNNINSWATSNYPVNVFLARIVPSLDGSLTDGSSGDGTTVNDFNNNVASIATNRSRTRVFVVNQQTGAGINNTANTGNPAYYGDNLHPNQSGYDLMADKWLVDLNTAGVLPSCP
jgi:lysophospholipase L1-like esterase